MNFIKKNYKKERSKLLENQQIRSLGNELEDKNNFHLKIILVANKRIIYKKGYIVNVRKGMKYKLNKSFGVSYFVIKYIIILVTKEQFHKFFNLFIE
ncbi:hypothetical protein NLV77_002680 [Staphylococcus ureilyticus]|nr:hypothetical protein [Staphylococcus ureilyticus]